MRRRIFVQPEYTFTRFEQACAKYPANTAIVFLGEKFSYRDLKDKIDRFATGLTELGLKKGDKMLVYLSNSVQFVVAFFAAQKIGVVVVMVSPIYTSHEIEYMVKDSGAETIICHDTNYGYVKEVFARTGLKRIIVTNLLDLVSPVKRLVASLFDKNPHGSVKGGDETVAFKTLLKSQPSPPHVDLDPY